MTPSWQGTCHHDRDHRPGITRETPRCQGTDRTGLAPPQTEPCRIDHPSGQARATGPDGAIAQALQTGDARALTAAASIRTVADTLTPSLRAAFSAPAASGAGFARTIPDTTRTDTIPGIPARTGKALKTGGGTSARNYGIITDGGTGK
jgi:hypothetical protein